ncbi:MAG: hypothetical protein NDJ94_24435 [Vicinamibacteria bacterium]|nr:hypothetical protein [Vicinamibacteria bacterium]
MRRFSALLIALGPGGSLLLALAFIFLSARAAGWFEDPEVSAAIGLVDGLLLAMVLGRQPPARRRVLLVLLLVGMALGLRACLESDTGATARAWTVALMAAAVALAASLVQSGPAPRQAPQSEAGSPDLVRSRFRRGQWLALGAVVAWCLGVGACAVAATTDATNLAIGAAVAGLFLMLFPPLLLPQLLRCPGCGFETMWQGIAPRTCRSCGARLR